MESNTSSPQQPGGPIDSNLVSSVNNNNNNNNPVKDITSQAMMDSSSISSVSSSLTTSDDDDDSGGEDFDTASERAPVAADVAEEEDYVSEVDDDVAEASSPVFVKMPVAVVTQGEDDDDVAEEDEYDDDVEEEDGGVFVVGSDEPVIEPAASQSGVFDDVAEDIGVGDETSDDVAEDRGVEDETSGDVAENGSVSNETMIEPVLSESLKLGVVENEETVIEPVSSEDTDLGAVEDVSVEVFTDCVVGDKDSEITKLGTDDHSQVVETSVDVAEPEKEIVTDSSKIDIVNEKPDVGIIEQDNTKVTKIEVEGIESEENLNVTIIDDMAERGVDTVDEAELVDGSVQTSPLVEKASNPDDDDDVAEREVEDMELVNNGSSETSPALEKADNSDDNDEKLEELVNNSIPDVEKIGTLNEQSADEEVYLEAGSEEEETDGMVFGSSEAARQFMEELEREAGSSSSQFVANGSHEMDGQIATDSEEEEEEVETDGDDEKEVFDSAAFAALLKAATGGDSSEGGNITITSQDGSRLFSIERPAGLGSVRSAQPVGLGAGRPNCSALFAPTTVEPEKELSKDEKKKLDSLQKLRVKFLRLVRRLGASPEDSVAAQVLYRLAIIAGRSNNRAFSLEEAKATALELEAEGKDDLGLPINILVLGKCGVGKSSTINSIFGEEKAKVGAFEPGTTSVGEIVGVVDGVKIKVIDTPGLKPAVAEQGFNRKVLSSVKKFTKKSPPDIILYVDRLDTPTRDLNDLPLLKTVTGALGATTWRNAIVALTHGASAPPEGPNGVPLNYEMSVTQRSHVVQQCIGHTVGGLMSPSLMNPISLVENHPLCRKNREGQKVLPNGQTWRPQLLLLCYSMKILAEANLISKPQDPFDHRKLFGFRTRLPPLPYLLSSMLQSRAHPKLASDQGIDNGDLDADVADFSDSDNEDEEDEYDQLPPFKPLRKAQVEKLSKEQRKAYFEEFDYRVKLLQKKQWREEVKRVKEMKKRGKGGAPREYDDFDQEPEGAAPIATPMPDMSLPPTFDSDNPAYRYRFLEPTSQFVARPVLDTNGWDHDCGYDGVNLEQSLAVASKFPANVTVQVTKDKKDFSIHLDSSIAAKHGEDGSTMAGFDIQNVGKQLAYIVRGETKFKNLKKNKTAAGISVTFLGENVTTGLKIEDQIAINKQWAVVGSAGTVRCQGESAHGANFEVQRREIDYPIGQVQSTYSLSVIRFRGDWALGFNTVAQFAIGRNSKVAVRAGINNKMSGQITARTSSSDHLSLVLVGIIPIASAIYKKIWPAAADNYLGY